MYENGDELEFSEDICNLIHFGMINLKALSPDRKYMMIKDLKGKEKFVHTDEEFDIIFCRNVMIYFDFKAQQRLIDNLYNCLKPGGYLFMGDAELLTPYKHNFDILNYGDSCYYQKKLSEKRGLNE